VRRPSRTRDTGPTLPDEPNRISNRELCRQVLDAYRPDRLDALLELLHPRIEWATTETWIEREVWYGHGGVRRGLERFFAEWERFSHDLEEFRDAGDRFAVVTRMRGRARHTGIATEKVTAGVCEVRDGLIIKITGYSDPAAALRAVAAGEREEPAERPPKEAPGR
jgi:ketosteroid isomerase-like protein